MRTGSFVLLLLAATLLLASESVYARRSADGVCACPRIYDPVCGTDLSTYANRCLLDCKAEELAARSIELRVLRRGGCEDPIEIAVEEQPAE
ncbi:serine protease inhibitor Kazal-type 1-like [Anopheles maculipalpis]|uniref:serine protease inhibitor Kazal-type 1-like n=1 Tax=Anopheles maculipalpis TaxID=1496333 RepID=UPI0021596198|nr:serine protease inhibitor Kazal-type 1-like [Anopheles maculipalpis]